MTAPTPTKTLNKEDLMFLTGFLTAFQRGQLKIPAKSKSIAHCAKMRLYRAAKKLLGSDELIRNYPDLFEARRETSVAVREIDGNWFVVISRVDATEFNTDFRAAMEGAIGAEPLKELKTAPASAMSKDEEASMQRMKDKMQELTTNTAQEQARNYLGD